MAIKPIYNKRKNLSISMKNKNGFGLLLGIIITTAIILLAVFGRLYSNRAENQKSVIETGIDAKQKTKETMDVLNKQTEQINEELR